MKIVQLILVISTVLIISTSIQCTPIDDVSSHAAFIWSGFDHTWQRREAGFETPHRIGSIANFISNETHSVDAYGMWSGEAQAHATFTPGVDGDYAFPKMVHTGVYSPAITVHRETMTFSYTDLATGDKDPEAKTSKKLSVPIPPPPNSDSQIGVILSGFDIQMVCDPSKQPDGKECNSNGTWPYYFNLQFNVQYGAVTLEYDFYRAWTPSKGGGKPFNYAMTYTVTVSYTVIFGDSTNFRPMPSLHLTHESDLHHGPETGNIGRRNSSMLPNNIQAIDGIGFKLIETDGFKRLGRYLESLQFMVHNTNTTEDKVTSDYTVAYNAPKTVFNSLVQLDISTSILSFDHYAQLSEYQVTNGTICDDGNDAFFKCHDVGLPNDTSDVWRIKV
eukprot:TRINITY_DN3127_c0_g1_i2.p1 TRINITY_DN3127_c0_g1~~TRINITY_DN3127_c0_g1_i2.p1  ORF type:complete len:453 (-),score=89.72 TRINITY_DN3127_c0_g1_i2:105-1271(-)